MEEDKKLILEETFDTAQNILGSITRTGSSLIQSGVQATDDFIDQNIPGGEQFTDNWKKGAAGFVGASARFIQQELEAADRQVDRPIDNIGNIPYFVVGAFNRGKQQYTENAQRLAESAGIDPRAGNVLGEVAGEIALVGAGKLASAATKGIPPSTGGMVPQLATAGSAPMGLTPSGGSIKMRNDVFQPPTVNKLTVTDEKYIAAGVRQDIAEEFSGQLNRYQARKRRAKGRLKKWLDETDHPRRGSNIKKSRDNMYGEFSTGVARNEDISDEIYYKTMPNLIPGFERHHLFPKAESHIIVKRMQTLIDSGVADYDDLVNLFLYAEDAGAVMGNRKANMLLMDKMPQHGPHHRWRETTEGAFGMVKEPANLQDLADVFDTATNANELMALFDEYLVKNIKPSKVDAFARTMKKNRELLTTLSEQDRRRL